MASDHVLALSHIAVFGAGLMTVAILSRGLAHTKRRRVRSDDTPRRAAPAFDPPARHPHPAWRRPARGAPGARPGHPRRFAFRQSPLSAGRAGSGPLREATGDAGPSHGARPLLPAPRQARLARAVRGLSAPRLLAGSPLARRNDRRLESDGHAFVGRAPLRGGVPDRPIVAGGSNHPACAHRAACPAADGVHPCRAGRSGARGRDGQNGVADSRSGRERDGSA